MTGPQVTPDPAQRDLSDRSVDPFVGINWGSTSFRAYLIGADGSTIDEYTAPAGVTALDRDGMVRIMREIAARWPRRGAAYASGMIGSNVGWLQVPYVQAPAGCADLAGAAVSTHIGDVPLQIIPGISCCRSFDGEPDILRGEEIELIGLAALRAMDGWVALPGTHTKWARVEQGRVTDFFTSMSGEIFDRLTTKGLLASIVEGEATDGVEFLRGVDAGSGMDPDAAERVGPRGSDTSSGIGSLQCDALQKHTHSYKSVVLAAVSQQGNAAGQSSSDEPTSDPDQPARITSETRPKNIAVNYIIRFR